jgi:hypothetical protein
MPKEEWERPIQKLVADLKYADCGFEDVRDEPSYVVGEISKIIQSLLTRQREEIIEMIEEHNFGNPDERWRGMINK